MKSGLSHKRLLWLAGLVALAVALVVLPMVLHHGGSFQGSDDRALEAITAMGSPVHPWFQPLWQPDSDSLKTALFAFQAALGLALMVAFFVVKKYHQRQD